jgi:hypothetical protein
MTGRVTSAAMVRLSKRVLPYELSISRGSVEMDFLTIE